MKHDEHRDERTYADFYALNNSEADDQDNRFDEELRSSVSDVFREMILSRNPELWQSLSMTRQYELKNTSKFIVIEKKLKVLTSKAKIDSTARGRRKTLSTEKRMLVFNEL